VRKKPQIPQRTGEYFSVDKLAKLAGLNITEQEKVKFRDQFIEILNYLEKLRSLKTEKIEETSQVTNLENVIRKDKAEINNCLSQEEALSNTKSKYNGFFKVKGIFNEE